jgi:hypothetical protein
MSQPYNLGNVVRQVAHSLQIDNSHHGCGNAAKVARYWLMEGKDFQAFLGDFVLFGIYLGITFHHLLGEADIAFPEGARGLEDSRFDQAAQRENLPLEVVEVAL